ncbi:transposase [Streptomyces sp. NPDC101225]|uniref:transposase n=1 Tax=Streptomyces sp. NPDC101225 TaxID=3366135 RepID=UPI00380FD40C
MRGRRLRTPQGGPAHAPGRTGRLAAKTSAPHHHPRPARGHLPHLVLRGFEPDPTAVDTRWCGDIIYIATEEGRCYLATVIDIASRRVVGWATADHLRTELVGDALRAARRTRSPAGPVIFHSDQGSTPAANSLSWQGSSVSDCPSAAPGSAGTTRCAEQAHGGRLGPMREVRTPRRPGSLCRDPPRSVMDKRSQSRQGLGLCRSGRAEPAYAAGGLIGPLASPLT